MSFAAAALLSATVPVFARNPPHPVPIRHPHPAAYHAPAAQRETVVRSRRSVKRPRIKPHVIVGHPPVVVVHPGVGIERPHLREAMEALVAARQTMAQSGNGDAAMGQLRSAYSELNASSPADVYHGNRYDAIQCTKRALKLLKGQHPTGEVASLTNEAIGHVQYCLQAPRE